MPDNRRWPYILYEQPMINQAEPWVNMDLGRRPGLWMIDWKIKFAGFWLSLRNSKPNDFGRMKYDRFSSLNKCLSLSLSIEWLTKRHMHACHPFYYIPFSIIKRIKQWETHSKPIWYTPLFNTVIRMICVYRQRDHRTLKRLYQNTTQTLQ